MEDDERETKPSCATCKFWFIRFRNDQEGECRRHAPVLYLKRGTTDEVRQSHPSAYGDYWCGDHEDGPPLIERTAHRGL